MSSDSESGLPRHVAIIMDGNGRWARRRLMPRLEGHRQGAKSVRRAVEFCRENHISFLTLYAFSTENWNRPETEVSGLMKLLSQFIDDDLDELHSNDIKIRIMGQMERLPKNVREKLTAAITRTAENKSLVLNIALSYGGRQDIIQAATKLCEKINAGEMAAEDLTEDSFALELASKGLPDPDLLIRTGGEIRISNFLLWQCAYSELYFTDTLWPDFDKKEFIKAINEFRARQRRYGLLPEQLSQEK